MTFNTFHMQRQAGFYIEWLSVSGNSIQSLVVRSQVITKPFVLPFERMPTNVNHIECHVYDGPDAIMLVFFAAHL